MNRMRTPVVLREARLGDAAFLLTVWQDSLRRAEPAEQLADVEQIIIAAGAAPEQRLVIAEFDGCIAGAAFLKAATLSPLNLEPILQVLAPHVVDDYQRKGVGHALMQAAVTFAEELGIDHVASAASWGSRDGNRYLARLGFGPLGVYRSAPTKTVRAKLNAQRPTVPRARAQLGQVLAARRSMKRSQPV